MGSNPASSYGSALSQIVQNNAATAATVQATAGAAVSGATSNIAQYGH